VGDPRDGTLALLWQGSSFNASQQQSRAPMKVSPVDPNKPIQYPAEIKLKEVLTKQTAMVTTLKIAQLYIIKVLLYDNTLKSIK
jgi:hypothetical protein